MHATQSPLVGRLFRPQAIAVALFPLLALSLSACAGGDADTEEGVAPVAVEETTGYEYFGSVEIARGSSIEMNIESAVARGDLEILSAPPGVTPSLSNEGDITTLVVEIADDAQIGASTLTFGIAGEAEPVDWTILISG